MYFVSGLKPASIEYFSSLADFADDADFVIMNMFLIKF